MPARIVRLRTKADRLRQAEAAQLRQLVIEFADTHRVSDRAVGEIVATIDRETAARNGWTFVMISPEAHDAVVEWLTTNSARPIVAVRLWSKLFLHVRYDTGEIVQTRDELAAAVGTTAAEVSRVMTQLEGIGAIIKRRDGRGVRYFMSPRIGSHLTGAARTKAQARAPKLSVVPVE